MRKLIMFSFQQTLLHRLQPQHLIPVCGSSDEIHLLDSLLHVLLGLQDGLLHLLLGLVLDLLSSGSDNALLLLGISNAAPSSGLGQRAVDGLHDGLGDDAVGTR